jgi:Spy/CpxP family protein refolding chaperone
VYRLRASNGSGQEVRGSNGAKTSFFEDVKRELDLDENQANQIGAIVDETRTQYRALKAECQPRYDALRLKARERIRGLLKPEQQERFNTLLNQRDARRSQENKE